MRDIKFRAWDGNEMQYLNKCVCYPKEKAITGRWELMQFTGLQDKNGKDVYEGDILIDTLTKMTYVVKFGRCIKFAYNGWYVQNDNYDYTTTINGDYDTDINSCIEIIGNIYEHPELIK